jgi:hypothetical protein
MYTFPNHTSHHPDAAFKHKTGEVGHRLHVFGIHTMKNTIFNVSQQTMRMFQLNIYIYIQTIFNNKCDNVNKGDKICTSC